MAATIIYQGQQYDLLVIVGPTASGKTALAIELAKKYDGEVICADSRTVYKGMDIGTAKPAINEMQGIKHHLLDVVGPDESFTVADFKELAEQAITDVRSRNKLPIMVGGSGLYVDAVLYDYDFAGSVNAARDNNNPRHRAAGANHSKKELLPGTLIIGLNPARDLLKQKLAKRVDEMIERGFVEEVKSLTKKYPHAKALAAPEYRAFNDYIDGRMSLEEAKAEFVKRDYQLAKRQMTWFKRNQDIHWFETSDEASACLVR